MYLKSWKEVVVSFGIVEMWLDDWSLSSLKPKRAVPASKQGGHFSFVTLNAARFTFRKPFKDDVSLELVKKKIEG